MAQTCTFIPSSCVRLFLPHVGAFQSGQGLLLLAFLFLRYGLLEPCLKSSAFPSPLFRLLSIGNFRPPSRELVSVPLRLDLTCHQDASLRIRPDRVCTPFGFAFFSSVFSALLSLSSSANVLFFQAARSRGREYKRRIKSRRVAAALFSIPSVLSCSLHTFKCSVRCAPAATSCCRHGGQIPPRLVLDFLLFFCLLWLLHKFLQIASLLSGAAE